MDNIALVLITQPVPGPPCTYRTFQRFAAVIMRIREPKTTALIFASGKMVCARARLPCALVHSRLLAWSSFSRVQSFSRPMA